ncbi:MAG: hypothetical protein AAGF47_02765 [Planctomycetota bacterium]
MTRTLLTIGLLVGTASGQTIDLAATAATDGRIAEYQITGSFAEIGLDPDGLYDVNDPGTQFQAIDLFPNEAAFGLGALSYDNSALAGVGTETVPVTGIDLSSLWSSGSATTDISDAALGLWFFDAPRSFQFGALDAADTVTFVNGVIQSVNLTIDASFVVDYSFAGAATAYDGVFSITGDTFALAIDEIEFDVQTFLGPVPASRFELDISGRIASIPAPGTAAGLALAGLLATRRRRG